MENKTAKHIASTLSHRFGIEWVFKNQTRKEGELLILRLDEIPEREGFNIEIEIGWKKITIKFEPEDNSGQLLLAMGNSGDEKFEEFSVLARTALEDGASLEMGINEKPISPTQSQEWPRHWRHFQLSLKSPFIETDSDLILDGNLADYILRWTTVFMSMLFTVLPTEEEPVEENVEGLPEGAQTKVLVNRYERSKINRQICIAKYGAFCNICGFDFGKNYGPDGNGYIEVHHIIPVSKLGENYRINPLTDLIPLCANCHAMIHRRIPPYSVDEVKTLLEIHGD